MSSTAATTELALTTIPTNRLNTLAVLWAFNCWESLAALAAMVLWLLSADLTETERTTLDPATLWGYTVEHLQLTLMAAVIVLVIAIPLGIVLTRPSMRRFTEPGHGRCQHRPGGTRPSAWLSSWPSGSDSASGPRSSRLVAYAILPVLTNTMVGLKQVDERLVEAGRGMGMSSMAVLFKVELPLAVPVMLSGIRTALVLLVGTATLAAFINGGGLGILITTGVNLNLTVVLIAGSLLVALLALLIDWLGRVVRTAGPPEGTVEMMFGKLFTAATLVAAAGVLLTGCGLAPAASYVPEAGPGSIAPLDGLPENARLTVTSKAYTEQLVLGKIAVLAAQAAGFKVTDLTGVPGSQPARELLHSGQANMMWEYTGTAWMTYLGHEEGIANQKEQWKKVHDQDLGNGMTWGKPAPMNNTYAMAVRSEAVEKLGGITKMSQLKDLPAKDRTFCVDAEFNSRSDGLNPMLEHYGLKRGDAKSVPDSNVGVYDTGAIYSATDCGQLQLRRGLHHRRAHPGTGSHHPGRRPGLFPRLQRGARLQRQVPRAVPGHGRRVCQDRPAADRQGTPGHEPGGGRQGARARRRRLRLDGQGGLHLQALMSGSDKATGAGWFHVKPTRTGCLQWPDIRRCSVAVPTRRARMRSRMGR